jgi:hypothetical protein
VLTYLDPVFEDDDGLKAQLVKQLKSIAENINAFGMWLFMWGGLGF